MAEVRFRRQGHHRTDTVCGKKTQVGIQRRKEIEDDIVSVERGDLWVCRMELERIVGVIGKVGWFAPPSVVRRGLEECPICYEGDSAYLKSGHVVLKYCGTPKARHFMCGRCFISWFFTQSQSRCPLCQEDLEFFF